jgi:natural product precursor
MKKIGKLTLTQETLRNLNQNELRKVAGGFATVQTACNCSAVSCIHSVCATTCIPAVG